MGITVSMTQAMYDHLIKGRKPPKDCKEYSLDKLPFDGCKDRAGVIRYVNQAWGIRGVVTDIAIE